MLREGVRGLLQAREIQKTQRYSGDLGQTLDSVEVRAANVHSAKLMRPAVGGWAFSSSLRDSPMIDT